MAFGMSPFPLQFGSRGLPPPIGVTPDDVTDMISDLGGSFIRSGSRPAGPTQTGASYVVPTSVAGLAYKTSLRSYGVLVRAADGGGNAEIFQKIFGEAVTELDFSLVTTVPPAVGVFHFSISDGGALAESIRITYSATLQPRVQRRIANVVENLTSTITYNPGDLLIMRVQASASEYVFTVNGEVLTGTAGIPSGLDTIYFGAERNQLLQAGTPLYSYWDHVRDEGWNEHLADTTPALALAWGNSPLSWGADVLTWG